VDITITTTGIITGTTTGIITSADSNGPDQGAISLRCGFVSWDRRFYDPIELPGRKPLVTLRDAAQYVLKLPVAAI